MKKSGLSVLRSRLKRVGKPALAEIVCAGLALLCLLAPIWWTLEEGQVQRLREMELLLRNAAESSTLNLSSWARSAEAEARTIAADEGVLTAARAVLESSDRSARIHFSETAAASLVRFQSGNAARFLLADHSGKIAAESRPGIEQIVRTPPPSIAPWQHVTGRSIPSKSWLMAVSVPVALANGEDGWLIYGIESLPFVERELQNISSTSSLMGAYAVSTEESAWVARSGSLAMEPCRVRPNDLLAAATEQGTNQTGVSLDGFNGCAGETFAAWSRETDLGLLVFVETDSKAAMRILRVGRMTMIGLAALLGSLILILILLQTSESGIGGIKLGAPRKNTAAWGILAVSLLTTAIAGTASKMRYQQFERDRIEAAAVRLTQELRDRIDYYAQAMTASAAVYKVLPAQENIAWREFTESLQLSEDFPGFNCLYLILASPEGANKAGGAVEIAGSITAMPNGCPVGNPDQATLRQLEALGTRSRNSQSLEAARMRWSSEGEEREWLALVEPVSRNGDSGLEAQYGWVVAFADLKILFDGVDKDSEVELQFALYEGTESSPESLIFASSPSLASPEGHRVTTNLQFGGASWVVAVAPSQPVSPPFEENYPFQVVLAGLAISVLLFDIALVLSSTRARAIGIAALMTERFRDSEERIRAVIDHASDGIIAFDSDGRISTYNPGAAVLFGYPQEEVLGLRIDDLISGWDPSRAHELSAASPDIAAECVGLTKDGESFPAEITVSRMKQVNGPNVYSAIIRDITARKLTEEKLRESEERYALASRGANDGLWDWNLKTNSVYFSSRWKEIIGATEEDIGTSPEEWFDRVHPRDIEALRKTLNDHLEGRTSFFESEHRVKHASGEYRWVLSRAVAVRDEQGVASRLAGSQTDVTNRKHAEKQLRYDALHDQLTGLPNRSYFMAQLENARAAASQQSPALFSLLFLDVDRFKVVNDSLGHLIGDQLLVAIAGRLKACVRPGDSVCRLGGDEFAVLAERISGVDDATRLAERIQEKLQEPLRVNGHEVFAAVSIGIALSSDGRRSAEEMLRNADIAMYRAKSQGRGRYELFDRRMHAHAVEVLQIETDLRRAVERNEFVLHYQPILDLVERRVLSCEALLRWNHPRRGLIYPGQFVSIAEETGLINEISRWLLKEACNQNRAWRDAGLPPICVSVNISPRQFVHQDVAGLVEGCLADAGLEPSSLQLELTEGALMESSETSLGPLTRLYRRGVQISLDDFGTGYSSLVYLRRFPIHNIKIDQSFVKRVPADSGDVAVVAGLIGLAHTLGLRVIAEGVETPAQLEFLRDNGCDAVQGYLLGRPRDAESTSKVLEEASHPVVTSLRDLQSTMMFD